MQSNFLHAAFVCAFVIFAPSIAPARDIKDEIDSLYNWACEQGKYGYVDQRAAVILGFPNAPPEGIPVIRKAYQDNQTRFIYAFNVFIVNDTPAIIMFKITTELSALWLLSLESRILRAAEATKLGSGPVPVDRYHSYLIETKDYLLKERIPAISEKPLTGKCQTIPEFTEK